MISCRKHANNIERVRQNYKTRQNKIRLGMNEYVPSMPEELFKEVMKGFTKEIASSYPEINQAYDSLSKYLSQPRDRLLLTSGADAAIKMTLETFCDPGDEIATISPTFLMYKIHASLLNCKFSEILCDKDGACSLDNLLSLLKTKTKAVIIANPNGVTGFTFSVSNIRNLVEKAEKQNTVVIIDETYADFGGINTSVLLEDFSNLIIIRSFSKNIGMAGLRIGYILTSEHLAGMIEKFKPMMEISSMAVNAIVAICSNKKYLQKAVKNIVVSRGKFADGLADLGYKVIERGGNFVLVDFGDRRKEVLESLEKNNIEYRVFGSPLKKYIRITVGIDEIMSYVLIQTMERKMKEILTTI